MATAKKTDSEVEKEPEVKWPDVDPANIILYGLIENAKTLREQKSALYDKIEANRQSLRNLDTGGLLPPEVKSVLAKWYPFKKSGNGKKEETA